MKFDPYQEILDPPQNEILVCIRNTCECSIFRIVLIEYDSRKKTTWKLLIQ